MPRLVLYDLLESSWICCVLWIFLDLLCPLNLLESVVFFGSSWICCVPWIFLDLLCTLNLLGSVVFLDLLEISQFVNPNLNLGPRKNIEGSSMIHIIIVLNLLLYHTNPILSIFFRLFNISTLFFISSTDSSFLNVPF